MKYLHWTDISKFVSKHPGVERKVKLGRDKADSPWVQTEWLVCVVYYTNISVLYFLFGNELKQTVGRPNKKRYAPAQFSPSPCPSVVGPLRIQGSTSEPSVHSWPWEIPVDARTPLRQTVLLDLGQRYLLWPPGLVWILPLKTLVTLSKSQRLCISEFFLSKSMSVILEK